MLRASFRLPLKKRHAAWAVALLGLAIGLVGPTQTQNAVANGDTRTISLIHSHTKETITATFRVNGSYDQGTLDKLNWFLRDWRLDEPTRMDPALFDVIWEAYRQSGSREPIMVMSAYRSARTNAMLRRRSRAVAEHSQHILGKAMDQHYLDVSAATVREIAMKMQRGGVGYYPTAGSPFVHMDVGGVRSWPRMSYDQLARLFPDGKTVHIPSNGQPLARYEEARAEIEASGSRYVPVSSVGKSKSFFAALFGGEDDEDGVAAPTIGRGRRQLGQARIQVASAASNSSNDKDDSRTFFVAQAQNTQVAALETPAKPAPTGRRGKPAPVVEPKAAAPAPTQTAVAAPPVVAPIPEIKPKAPAPEPVSRPEAPANVEAPDNAPDAVVAALPTPPRRPTAILALLAASNVPMPPARPVELLARASIAPPDQIASLIGTKTASGDPADVTSALPEVITRGLTISKPTPVGVLGYADNVAITASAARPVIGVRPAPVYASLTRSPAARPSPVAVKIDRGSFHALTSSQPASETSQSSALGVAAPPLRASVRSQTASLFAEPQLGVAGRFGDRAASLPTDHFAILD